MSSLFPIPHFATAVSALSLMALLSACGSDPVPAPLCTPGASVACVGAGGCAGGQSCNPAGTGFGMCVCGGPVDGGPPDAGPVDAGMRDMASDDGGIDMSNVDGGPPPTCNPITHSTCAPGERCVRVHLTPDTGELRCVANGTAADGAACAIGADGPLTGFDDCVRGSVCVAGTCARVCDLEVATSCGADTCVRYSALFANADDTEPAGACVPGCDVVSQLRRDGSSCGAGEGCFLTAEGGGICASASRTLTHGQVIVGTVFLNSCAPGHVPLRFATPPVCAALCRPIETHSGATAGAAGMSPFSCPDRGAASPPNECVFLGTGSTVGVCRDTSDTYDDDGDPGTPEVPTPSCITLPNTDTDGDGVPQHAEAGCAPMTAP